MIGSLKKSLERAEAGEGLALQVPSVFEITTLLSKYALPVAPSVAPAIVTLDNHGGHETRTILFVQLASLCGRRRQSCFSQRPPFDRISILRGSKSVRVARFEDNG